MLVPCPECGREVSDRAHACIGCGFPIAEHFAAAKAQREQLEDRATRSVVGETDCPTCEARGFVLDGRPSETPTGFQWCDACEHTGRVALVESKLGHWAVAHAGLTAFLEGGDSDVDGITFLGKDAPTGHRYRTSGPRHRG
jgi:hypothetical protein